MMLMLFSDFMGFHFSRCFQMFSFCSGKLKSTPSDWGWPHRARAEHCRHRSCWSPMCHMCHVAKYRGISQTNPFGILYGILSYIIIYYLGYDVPQIPSGISMISNIFGILLYIFKDIQYSGIYLDIQNIWDIIDVPHLEHKLLYSCIAVAVQILSTLSKDCYKLWICWILRLTTWRQTEPWPSPVEIVAAQKGSSLELHWKTAWRNKVGSASSNDLLW